MVAPAHSERVFPSSHKNIFKIADHHTSSKQCSLVGNQQEATRLPKPNYIIKTTRTNF